VYGEDGTPLHSWRVLLLPYIEQDELYKQFKLGEPWDSPHNIRLLERMPRQYAPPWREYEYPPHHTVCHVFVGKGTPFERDGLRSADFPDGASNTFLVVEAGDPVPWTKPAEIEFAPDRPLRLRGPFKNIFRACFADGSVRYIRSDADEATLRALVTRNGREPLAELNW
jgi:hypothetical protein